MTIEADQTREMIISPNLDDVDETTDGVYYDQNVWILDEATLMPVGVRHNVTFT